jgi:uncharacterized membrane protein YhaH (DUF805 family)
MDILECPSCMTRVMPRSDGICPSCRACIAVQAGEGHPLSKPSEGSSGCQASVREQQEAFAPQRNHDEAQLPNPIIGIAIALLRLFFWPSGRIGRVDFVLALFGWYALLFGIVVNIGSNGAYVPDSLGMVLLCLNPYVLLTLMAKRWHDRNKSGFWTLFWLVPVIGGLWCLTELLLFRGTAGRNRFGPPAATFW